MNLKPEIPNKIQMGKERSTLRQETIDLKLVFAILKNRDGN
jgi:hypothetical protein